MPPAPSTASSVVELSTMITASAAGMMLADMGADVIKVENPNGGDPFRSFGPSRDYSAHFCSYNRNKRARRARPALGGRQGRRSTRCSPRGDVLLENFRPGVLDRLGYRRATARTRSTRG